MLTKTFCHQMPPPTIADMLLALATLAVAGSVGLPAPPPRARLVLAFERAPAGRAAPSRLVTGVAMKELAEIWALYAVAIELEGESPCASDVQPARISVVIVGGPDGAADAPPLATPLAAIHFSDDGAPEPLISVFYDEIVRLVASTPFMDIPRLERPKALRDDLLGRALGRVLAHEIGHFLLRMHDHTSGLMRAGHAIRALIDIDRSGFRLTRGDVERLRAAISTGGRATGLLEPEQSGLTRPLAGGRAGGEELDEVLHVLHFGHVAQDDGGPLATVALSREAHRANGAGADVRIDRPSRHHADAEPRLHELDDRFSQLHQLDRLRRHAGGDEDALVDCALFLGRVDEERLGSEVFRADVRVRRPGMFRRGDDDEVVGEQVALDEPAVGHTVAHDGDVEAAIEQELHRVRRGGRVHVDIHGGMRGTVCLQQRRQPMITGVALRADAQRSFAAGG